MGKKRYWVDAGRDCDYCGDIILRRNAPQTERDDDRYFRCVGCGRQWSSTGRLVYRGQRLRRAERLRAADRARSQAPWLGRLSVPRSVLIAGGILLGLVVLVRFGLFGAMLGLAVRFLSLAMILGLVTIIAVVVYRMGKEYGWWDRLDGPG